MAQIIWLKGEKSLIDTWLVGDTTTVPAVNGNWGVGIGAQTGGVGTDKTKLNTNSPTTIGEIGQTADGGYSPRKAIIRGSGGWPAASVPGGGTDHQSTAPQVQFNFTGQPNMGATTNNQATLWFVAKTVTVGNDDCYFGADLSSPRGFNNGDSEKITITYRQTS